MPEDSRVPIILGRLFLATAQAIIYVFNKKITLRVGDDDEVIFDADQSIKRPPDEDLFLLKRALEKLIRSSELESSVESLGNKSDNASDLEKSIRRIDYLNTPYPIAQETTKPDGVESEHLYSASANEIDEKKHELKSLPHHLEYAYLHGDKSVPIIISSELSEKEKMLLLQVLEKRKEAIAWKMSDIKGISLSFCTHKILMGDDFKPVIQPQRRLNLKVQDVVKNEIDSSLIALKDQEKTTFTCPYGTFAYRRIPFGLCNAPATFQRCMTAIFHDMVEDFMEVFMNDFSVFDDNEPWYADYVNYIIGKIVPPMWTPKKRRRFFSQVKNYFWDETYAFRLCPDNVMRRCVAGNEILEILAHCHAGPTGVYHSASITGRKVYESGFFWPCIFKDAKDYVMRCDACQRSRNISSRSKMPQNNIQVKAQALNDARVVIKFLRRLLARFGVPKALIMIGGMEHTRTTASTRKELRNGMTLGSVGIKTLNLETRTMEITDKNGISFKVNGQRLKKYYDGLIDTDDKEVSPYGIFQFMDTAYWSPVQFIDLTGKEIDEVGEVSIIWNPICVL
ncbi:reverse transcriptase domain-containing protein [Tanacetum coccineum]